MGIRRLIQAAAAAGITAALLTTTAGIAGAGSSGFSIDPVSGPPGTVITATGGSCYNQNGGATVSLFLFAGDHDGDYGADGTPLAETDGIAVSAIDTGEETWHGTITVPADTPAGPITVVAECNLNLPAARPAARAQQQFFFRNQLFTVTPAPTTTQAPTTTSTTTPTTTGPATTTTAPAPATPAAPVVATPSYTG